MGKAFIYISYFMSVAFVFAALALIFFPPPALAEWSGAQRMLLAFALLLYAGFRTWRAWKLQEKFRRGDFGEAGGTIPRDRPGDTRPS